MFRTTRWRCEVSVIVANIDEGSGSEALLTSHDWCATTWFTSTHFFYEAATIPRLSYLSQAHVRLRRDDYTPFV